MSFGKVGKVRVPQMTSLISLLRIMISFDMTVSYGILVPTTYMYSKGRKFKNVADISNVLQRHLPHQITVFHEISVHYC